MTTYRFKQAVKILDHKFKVGIQEVPDEVVSHAHFASYLKCGWILEVSEAQKVAKPETILERSQRLHEALMPKTETPSEEESDDSVPEEKLTPQQKAARTRKLNADKAKSSKEE